MWIFDLAGNWDLHESIYDWSYLDINICILTLAQFILILWLTCPDSFLANGVLSGGFDISASASRSAGGLELVLLDLAWLFGALNVSNTLRLGAIFRLDNHMVTAQLLDHSPAHPSASPPLAELKT
jgi:hypothetical protein